jgi:hypothetical protein
MPDEPTFVCPDCGYDVYVYGYWPPGQTRCAVCQWLADHVSDPAERERLREFLGEKND